MRIGYCSPFRPMRSGISDYSEALVSALGEKMEVVIFSPVQIESQEITSRFEVHPLEDLHRNKLRETLDLIVYHIGNNYDFHGEILKYYYQYPGVLELHDIGLHHLAAESAAQNNAWDQYVELAAYCHGRRGETIAQNYLSGAVEAPWDEHSMDMPMNRKVIEAATAVIVHSDYAKQMVLGCRPEVPVTNIRAFPIKIVQDANTWKIQCRAALGLPEKKLIMGSFGPVTPYKRIFPIMEALKKFKQERHTDFLFYLVGDCPKEMMLPELVRELGLDDQVRITGYASAEEFTTYMGACDFCLNLRYPTQGETSGSLHLMLGMGKPVIVTDIGSFREFPDAFALKVSYGKRETDDIYRSICLLADSGKERRRRSKAALRFARKNCDIGKNAAKYKDFFENVLEHTWQPDYEDLLVGRLCELGLTEKAYLRHLAQSLEMISG